MIRSAAISLCLVVLFWPLQGLSKERPHARGGDEATIRGIVAHLEADQPDPHVSQSLSWENAFGIRYDDLKKRDAFYGKVVKPQFASADSSTLETDIRFVGTDVAVADTYWHVVGQVYSGETKPGPDRWGRTTYIFQKKKSAWTEIIERVTDLRLPYYKHLAKMPAAVVTSAGILQSYAGRYTSDPTKGKLLEVDVTVEGDHLLLTSKRGSLIAIPTSDTDFLVFFAPGDPAQYDKATFSLDGGSASYTLSEAWGASLGTLKRRS